MTSSLLWKHVSADQVNELNLMTDPDTVKEHLARLLDIPTCSVGPQASEANVLLNIHFHNFAFSKEQRFTPAQTSTFLSIFKTVVDEDRKQIALGQTLNKSFDWFEALILQHSIERSPVSVGVFGPDEIQAIVDYAMNGYYRHFKLYEYVFKARVHMTLKQVSTNGVECPKEPEPLTEGVMMDPTADS